MSDHVPYQPRTVTYLAVAGILTVLTVMEIAAYQIRPLAPVLVPVLLILMVAKFSLVVMFYMHLKFDHRLFTLIFMTLLFFAGLVVVSLVLLFRYLWMVHHD